MAPSKSIAPLYARRIPSGQGGVHDLQEILAHLNAKYFGNRVVARITWGIPRLGRRRQLILGTYTFEDRLITIHPALDHTSVPRFVVEGAVFHEMLHQLIPSVQVRSGARTITVHHTLEFRTAERRFPHYHLAEKWERRNAKRLHARMRQTP